MKADSMPHDPSQIIAPPGMLDDSEPYNALDGPAGPAPGTVFPSLSGGDPGEQDPGQNLGEFPYGESLHEMPLADGISSGVVSPAEVQRQAEQLPDPDAAILEGAAAAIPGGGTSVSNRKKSAEDRINQLTAKYRTTETERDTLAEQVAQLSQVIMSMQQSPNPQFQRSPGSGEASPSANPLAGLEPNANGGVDANSLRRVVQEAIAPLAQTVSNIVQTNQRSVSHNDSFARAVEDFPDLGKPGTEARRHFDTLYRTHPLANLEDGPEQLAIMVRGILASARRDSQTVTQRKAAASVHVPTPSVSDVVPNPQARVAQLDAAIKTATDSYRRGDRSFETYKLLRLANRARTQLRGR